MLGLTRLSEQYANGYIYGYQVPQLNKEFDLLRIGKECCVNVELKSHTVANEKIVKQLKQNKHYLKMVSDNVFLFTFDSEAKHLYQLLDDGTLISCEFESLTKILSSFEPTQDLDLDNIFKPNRILVSPLNDSDRFLKQQYLLTEDQENKKTAILSLMRAGEKQRFFGLTGGAGTGKTLLLYDIAFELALSNERVLVIHSGKMCKGHWILDGQTDQLHIIEAKELRYREIKGYDYVVVDESQRIYTATMEKIERWVNKACKKCLFAFDELQIMSRRESNRNTPSIIRKLCTDDYIFTLTNKIRTNKEIAMFITCLRDLSKKHKDYTFKNVTIQYESNRKKSVEIAKEFEKQGYKFISYTSSFFYADLDYQSSETNTHYVIGQEFDGVVMIINERFFYEGNKLSAYQHPNPDFIYTKLLYQGLTRARSKLHLIIQTEDLLDKIITLFKSNQSS